MRAPRPTAISAAPRRPMAASPGRSSISSSNCAEPSDPASQAADPVTPQRLLYGRRRGPPLRPAQQMLLQTLLPRLAVALPAQGALDPRRLFEVPPRAIWLEIGFGGGEH